MRLSSSVMAVAGTAAGVVAAALAYQIGVSGPAHVSSSTQSSQNASTVSASETPAPVVKRTWKPCEKGTKLRKGTCVKVTRRVVVVTDPAPARAAAPAEAPAEDSAQATSTVTHQERRDDRAPERSDDRTSSTHESADESSDDHGENEHADEREHDEHQPGGGQGGEQDD